MPKHPNIIWSARKWGTYPNTYVRTFNKEKIGIVMSEDEGNGSAMIMTRRMARLLAKRINQCLDETK